MGSYFVVKLKKSEDDSLGFSLLKAAGFSHVIYEINENIAYESPASESQVEAGDVIVKVNGTDVHRHSTKEVLKCLRLSAEPVTLELKRDPKIKDLVRKYLASSIHSPTHIPQKPTSDLGSSPSHLPKSIENHNINNKVHRVSSSDASVIRKSRIPINSNRSSSWSAPQSPQSNKARYQSNNTPAANGTSNFQQQPQQQPNNRARFEAYMMTGDLILNLSRTPQVSGLHTKARKLDSLGDSIGTAPQAKYDSSPSSSSPNYSEDSSGESAKSPTNNYKDINSKTHSNTNNNINNSRRNHNNNNKAVNNNADSNIEMNEEEMAANDVNDERDNIKNTNAGCASQSSSDVEEPENCNEFKKLIDNNGENADMTDFTSVPYKSQNEVYNMVRHNQMQNNYSLLTDKYTPYTNTPHVTPSASMSSTSTSSASTTINRSETLNTPTLDVSYSMPTSPTSLTTPLLENTAKKKELASSVPTSPESGQQEFIKRSQSNNHQQVGSMNVKKCDSAGFRTSRSEDHLQNSQREGLGAIVPIDIDEDVNSSLNTLLDTRQDSEDSQNSGRDRIVWTYNAPVPTTAGMSMGTNPVTSPISHSSSLSTSPQHTYSPASPTSVSSSVMSSSGSKGNGVSTSAASNNGFHNLIYQMNGDQSISEAISNISSPDYQDEHDLLSVRECATMALSDASDSDSTLLVSDTTHFIQDKDNNNKLVIQVKGSKNNPGTPTNVNGMYNNDSKDIEKEVAGLTSDFEFDGRERVKDSSPPVSDDGSDVDSLHSFHYSPKAVDIPSAVRLAKRLYYLDGFKKSDVSRHLSKNNEFSRVVADEYLKFFMFNGLTLDESLRKFLKQFSLSGETQERERVLVHFSKRYLECNPGTFNSQDAVHTLTCAIMLLNTDLHGQNIGRKMNCAEFIENLSELNDGENFPKDTLKQLYQAIKAQPLEWAVDDNSPDQPTNEGATQGPAVGSNPFLEVPQNVAAIEYKKGYVMRKCCFDSNNKKTPFGKRSWKMFYCTLRDMVLYLHKDERGFHKNQLSDNVHNAIRIHHSLASKASDYSKKQHVFRLQTADQSEYLFQTSDSKEVISWIDVINFVAARYSAAPLEGGVGSQKRFQRPLLPCSQTKFTLRVQLASHEEQVNKLNAELTDHRSGTMPSKGLALQNYKEKEAYLQYELKRYKTYVYLLNSHMNSNNSNDVINIIIGATNSSGAAADHVENDDNDNNLKIKQQQIQHGFTPIPFNPGSATSAGVQSTTTNRYSYRAAIYQSDAQTD